MMEGATADAYGSTAPAERSENSKLMATAMAGMTMDTAKIEAVKMKKMMMNMRDGPISIRILSYIAGIMLVVTSFFSFFGSFFTLHPVDAVVHLYMFIFGWVILVIEAKNSILPLAVVQDIHRYCAFTTVVWGRGAFFIFVGTLSLAQWVFFDIIVGFYLIAVGAGMIYWGQTAYKSLDALMAEMKDPANVAEMFDKFDHDQDGALDAKELGNLLKSLGAQLRPTEVEAAIIIMDNDQDGKISLDEFQAWWSRHDPPSVV